MQELEFHPDAAANFSEKADLLVRELEVATPEAGQPSFRSQRFVSHVVRSHEARIHEFSWVDFLGRPIGRSFEDHGRLLALRGDAHARLLSLAEAIQRTASFRDKVSTSYLADLIFEWIGARYRDPAVPNLTEYLLPRATTLLDDFEVWTPVAHLVVQSSFDLGPVTFTTIGADRIVGWGRQFLRLDESTDEHVQAWTTRQQKRLQGLAAGVVRVRAEPHRAYELALEWTEQAVSLLRFFGPWYVHPETVSYCAVLGQEHLPSVTQFLLKNDRLATARESGSLGELDYVVDDEVLERIRPLLHILGRLLSTPKRTPYQEKLLASLFLYSEASLAKRPQDKVVYVLAALESFLHENQTEPIQLAIGERMAFFLKTTAEERAAVIENFRRVYARRSAFLHHGVGTQTVDELRAFMMTSWEFFLQALQNADHFQNAKDLIAAIERVRLS